MIALEPFQLVFRFFHIVAGVLWVGAAFLFVGFIGPSAAEVGPSAIPLLTAAVKRRKVARVITGLGIVNVLAGWSLWLWDMHLYGSLHNWITSRFGLVLTIGGLLATTAAVIGATGVGMNVERLVDLGNEMAGEGGPPSADQQSRLAELGATIERHGKLDLALLLLAVTAMATARYW